MKRVTSSMSFVWPRYVPFLVRVWCCRGEVDMWAICAPMDELTRQGGLTGLVIFGTNGEAVHCDAEGTSPVFLFLLSYLLPS